MNFSEPKANILQMALQEGMRVADLGSGSGHYAHALAPIVGPSGKVYAVEIREDMLKHIKESVHHKHRGVVDTIWGDIEKPGGTGLRDHSLDAAVLANTLFQVENRVGLIAEIKRILKPGGKLLVIDWAGAYGGMGPALERVVPEHAAEELFTRAGFTKLKGVRAGPHHYGVIFTS